MTRQGLERKLVVLLFVMVLVVFSFAERDSRKFARLYTAAQALKKGARPSGSVAVKNLPKTSSEN